jgi:hypothetical protein
MELRGHNSATTAFKTQPKSTTLIPALSAQPAGSGFQAPGYSFGGGVVEKKKKRGPGAPPGNMNALKHGRTSKQFATLGALLNSDPQLRGALLALDRRRSQKDRDALDMAAYLFTRLLDHANQRAAGQLNLRLQTDDLNSILEAAAKIDPDRYGPDAKPRRKPKNNSRPGTNPQKQ